MLSCEISFFGGLGSGFNVLDFGFQLFALLALGSGLTASKFGFSFAFWTFGSRVVSLGHRVCNSKFGDLVQVLLLDFGPRLLFILRA